MMPIIDTIFQNAKLTDGTISTIAVAARTQAVGLQGKMAVSHANALGEVSVDIVRHTADKLAAVGVAIMTNAPDSYPFPPVLELRKAGVTVFSGSDNIRDSWWPYGDGDMLGRAMMIGYRSGFFTDEELNQEQKANSSARGVTGHDAQWPLHLFRQKL